MLSFWPERMVVVAKHSVLYIPFLGVVFWLLGNIVLDRKKHEKSIDAMTKAADEVRAQTSKRLARTMCRSAVRM